MKVKSFNRLVPLLFWKMKQGPLGLSSHLLWLPNQRNRLLARDTISPLLPRESRVVITFVKCTPTEKRKMYIILFSIIHSRKCNFSYISACDEAENRISSFNNLLVSNSKPCCAFLRQHCDHIPIQSMLTASPS